MKIVWLCHFSNDFVQSELNIAKKINEFAPWISVGIEAAKKQNEFELHIIAPHRNLSGTREFSADGIYYHFFNAGMPYIGRHWPNQFRYDMWTNFSGNRKKIGKFISKINPDVIHLYGAENGYYATSVLDFYKKIPVLLTIQGFLRKPKNGNINPVLKKRIENEHLITKKLRHFGVRTDAMQDEIKLYNDNPVFHWHEIFLNTPVRAEGIVESHDKKYDMIFFSRIIKAKGIEDFIEVCSRFSAKNKDFKAAVIGLSNPEYLEFLKDLAKDKECSGNIDFLGFLPTQGDVYKVLDVSKVFVIPTYNDTLSGALLESMFRNIPAVSYRTGGIPEINRDDKNIELVDQGDIEGLFERIGFLLENKEYREELAQKAYNFATKKWNNDNIISDLINIYKKIIKYGPEK